MAATFEPKVITAHDRLKASFWPYVSAAVVFSAGVHFLVLSTVRIGNVADYSYGGVALEQVELVEQKRFEVPPPPERIARPAIPVLSTRVDISSDITIGEVDFNQVTTILAAAPALPEFVVDEENEEPAFTPYEIRPKLLNAPDVQKALLASYPLRFQQAGVEGVAQLWIYIDEEGRVQRTRIYTSTGYEELDAIAQEVVDGTARFSPAFNRDVKVPVWIQMPVTFQAPAKLAG